MTGRGAGWVVTQFVLIVAVIASGALPPGWPGETGRLRLAVGLLLITAGVAFAVWASRTLGTALTPFPKPNTAGLVVGGPFAIVRHPIYLGALCACIGYSLLTSVAALGFTLALLVLWIGKSRVEEEMLGRAYDDYADYRQRVRWRLIPFVY